MTKKFTQYNILEDPTFKNFAIERNLKKDTIKNYKSALQKYCEFHQMTLQELLDEADNEEEQGIRLKRRTIKRRLTDFRTYLIENKNETNTIKGYFTTIKTFYRHDGIELPYISSAKLPQKQVMYDEIPHKPHIIEALQHTNNLKHKAILYFMISTGSARTETCNVTIQDFLDATYDYHHSTTPYIALEKIEHIDNIIPVFQLTRQKTNYRYYTCCTPEATKHILRWLKYKGYKNLDPKDKLFDVKPDTINKFFQRLNDSCRWPRGFFHPHSIRKYHTDIIQNKELSTILQGRKPDAITEAYYKQNPTRIKSEYRKHIQDLTLKPVKVVTIEDEEVKKLKNENKQIIKENEELKNDMDDLRDELDKFGKLLFESLKKNEG